MVSMGSIGSNFNEGGDAVQKPLVREFKTQGRLNRGIMATTTSQDDRTIQTTGQHTRKSNVHVTNFAKR